MSDETERWPHEPDDPGEAAEPDETAEPDEDEILAELGPDTPDVDVPEPPDPAETEVPGYLARNFWKLVMIFNLAVFALALGPMLIVFRGQVESGALVFALGAATFVYGYARYQRVREHHDTEGDGGDDQDSDQKA